MNMMKHLLVFTALLLLIGCRPQQTRETRQPQATVDSRDHRPLVITKEGQLFFESKAITDAELAAMVKDRVAKSYSTTGTVDLTVIMIQPDDQTPYGRVREIQDLIMKNGAHPGTSARKETQSGRPD